MCACLLVCLSAYVAQNHTCELHALSVSHLPVVSDMACFILPFEIVPYMVFISVAVSYGNVSASVGSAVKSRPTTAVASATNGTVFRLICTFVSFFISHIFDFLV